MASPKISEPNQKKSNTHSSPYEKYYNHLAKESKIAKRIAGLKNMTVIPLDHCENIRFLFCMDSLWTTLMGAMVAKDTNQKKLFSSYEQILQIQMEITARRSAAGLTNHLSSFDNIKNQLNIRLDKWHLPKDAIDLLESIYAKVRIQPSTKNANHNFELDKVLSLIQAMRTKTTDRGCTIDEAVSAAKKVAELLDRHGLSLSSIDFKNQSCETTSIQTNRKRQTAFDWCTAPVANFCDCKAWIEKQTDDTIRHIFFGLPADVMGAKFLFEKIEEAYTTQTDNFKKSDLYKNAKTTEKRAMVTSFQSGFINSVTDKLKKFKAANVAAMEKNTGRSLVVVKNNIMQDELLKMGMSFKTVSSSTPGHHAKAYKSGQISGMLFEWIDKVE